MKEEDLGKDLYTNGRPSVRLSGVPACLFFLAFVCPPPPPPLSLSLCDTSVSTHSILAFESEISLLPLSGVRPTCTDRNRKQNTALAH